MGVVMGCGLFLVCHLKKKEEKEEMRIAEGEERDKIIDGEEMNQREVYVFGVRGRRTFLERESGISCLN